ncbi:Metallo-hydrolase/oxidoreductase [Patellaria atrata CBS 101060]|uniref:Metallo-hydrolase/oxidoreductase n=1 Tax=Patellaria atrata CBS 101060 TaxID=1346257 RepID=A0A9P4SI48_9PEZI|nr:Metallo-hydrolase/oxidoreductase [Patellaria atrata CBS 101060]
MKHLTIDPENKQPPTRDHSHPPESLPKAKETKVHPNDDGGEDASLFFVGTATTILEWEGIRIMTDPNFLHKGDHVHLGPGVTAERLTNPVIDMHESPPIDVVFLSHYHEDRFDREVEASLRRDLPIITTPHAKGCLTSMGDDSFTDVHDLDFFQSLMLDFSTDVSEKRPAIKITGMPGKHVAGAAGVLNYFINAVPPTNGWMIELGYYSGPLVENNFNCGYRIYISGDTVMVDELKEIPERYRDQKIDLMLIHLGGTTIPSPSTPLLVVTMDAKQGVQLLQLIQPDITIPIHFDDYSVMLSPLEDFKKAVKEAGLSNKVVYLERKDRYRFGINGVL